MPKDFEQMPMVGANIFEAVTAATASSTKGLQAIATEMTDYSKNSFEKSRAHFEKLIGVKNISEAIQLQSDFAKSAYEDFFAEATKLARYIRASLRKLSSQLKHNLWALSVEDKGRNDPTLDQGLDAAFRKRRRPTNPNNARPSQRCDFRTEHASKQINRSRLLRRSGNRSVIVARPP